VNLLLILNGVAQVASTSATNVEEVDAWGSLLISTLTAILATMVLFEPVARRLAVIFPPFRGKRTQESDDIEPNSLAAANPSTPLFPQMLDYYTTDSLTVSAPVASVETETANASLYAPYQPRGFNPALLLHRVAVVFVCYLLGVQFANFILGGGLEGIAETYEEGLSGWSLLLNGLPFLVVSFLGVGLGIKRNFAQALQRLGLGLPTGQGLLVSIGVTIGLFVFVAIVATVWEAAVPEDVFEEQSEASEALSDSISTVWLALLLAATAAVGEEIAFRGALQPVLGLWPTAVIFSLTHMQYTLTPAWLIIFGVALAFGWIRLRYNTTVAIMAHFLYNFIPLAFVVSAPDDTAMIILHGLL
ncbi:MAG: CPBP family intramembrane metalloprotease, partial [Chloroflexi bacterium]